MVINEEIIKQNKKIAIILNDNNQERNIEISDKRKILIKYDTVIIEIKPDKDKINYFLEIEDIIFNEKENLNLEDIYIIQYLILENKENIKISYGTLKQVNDYNIIYYCYTEDGTLGSPILNSINNKVIGIYYESSNNYIEILIKLLIIIK